MKKKISFSFDSLIPVIPAALANVIYKKHKRALADLLYSSDTVKNVAGKIGFLGLEGFKWEKSSGMIMPDSMYYKFGKLQKDYYPYITGVCALILDDPDIRSGPAASEPWAITLRFMAMAAKFEFAKDALDVDTLAAAFETDDGAAISAALIPLLASLNILDYLDLFIQKILPSFTAKTSVAAQPIKDANPEDPDCWREIIMAVKQLLAVKKSFSNATRQLRNDISGFAEPVPQGVAAISPTLNAALAGDNLALALAARDQFETIKSEIINFFQNSLPDKFDADEIRDQLSRIQPPLPEPNMAIALREIEDVATGILKLDDSQLLTNILPALRGEAPFSEQRYDDSSVSERYAYTYLFIRRLSQGKYALRQESASDAENDKSASPKKEPVATGRAMVPSPAPLTGPDSGNFAEETLDSSSDPAADTPPESSTSEMIVSQEPVPPADGALIEMTETEDGEMPSAPVRENPEDDLNAELGATENHLASEYDTPETGPVIGALAANSGSRRIADNTDPLERKFLESFRGEDRRQTGEAARPALPTEDLRALAPDNSEAQKKSIPFGAANTPIPDESVPAANVTCDFPNLDQAMRAAVDAPSVNEPVEIPSSEIIAACFDTNLARGALCGLCHLALALGDESPQPAWLMELLQLGTRLLPRFSHLRKRVAEICAEATLKLNDLSGGQALLLAAASLRPALMMPDKSMATIASFLSNRLSNFALTPFFEGLRDFISRGAPMDGGIFTGQSHGEILNARHADLNRRTNEFLYRMRNSKTKYQPASQKRKLLFHPNNELGSILEACLAGHYAGLEKFTREYNADPKKPERLIDEPLGANHTKVIEASARQRLLADARQAVVLANEWLEYSRDAANAGSSYPLQEFQSLMDRLPPEREKLCQTVEGQLLALQLNLLAACPASKLPEEEHDPEAELALWPARVPLAPAGKKDGARLISFLHPLDLVNDGFVAASLVWHLVNGDIELCSRFLAEYPAFEKAAPDFAAIRGHVAEDLARHKTTVPAFIASARAIWNEKFDLASEEVKNAIISSEFRGAIHIQQSARYHEAVGRIQKKYGEGGDKASGVRELRAIIHELTELALSQNAEIEAEIATLRERGKLPEEARLYLDAEVTRHLREGMCSLAWHNLAEIKDHLASGRPLRAPGQAAANDVNPAKRFYERLERSAILPEGQSPYLQLWNETERELKNTPVERPTPKVTGIVTQLLRWFGFSISQAQHLQPIYAAGKPNSWRVFRIQMEIAGPLPQWGSANRQHTVAFGYGVSPEDINRLLNASELETEEPKTIICFNPLNAHARNNLVAMCAARKESPLVVDLNLFNFLCGMDDAARTDALFRVCLAGSSLIPYSDTAGYVPREMFFGRRDDIRAIRDPNGPCIIYGGRQLGKSALLKRILNDRTDDVKVLYHSMGTSETSILEAIFREFINDPDQIVTASNSTKTLAHTIRAWLEAHPEKRILFLLDECDKVLDHDREKKFDEIITLRDLMAATGRRFKIVLAGTHSVQRFSQISNQPFLHYGEPLCIGPLSPDAAHALMTEPMSILGFEFESENLVQLALNHCGYQPKLIQIFCMELLRAYGSRRRSPFERIDRATILKIYDSHNLKKKIVECFEMTLNLDERYLVTGYVMALNKDRSLDLKKLLGELGYYWPAAFGQPEPGSSQAGRDMLNSLKSLLHEMEGLGLVISLDNQYQLRTPNVIDLLGGEDQILQMLDPFESKPYKPSGNPDELRVQGAEMLVASQYNLLAEKKSLFRWISGSKALGIDSVGDALEIIADQQGFKFRKLGGASVSEAMAKLKNAYKNHVQGGLLCWINSAEFPFMEEFMLQAARWLENLRTGRKYVKLVCVVEPTTLRSLFKSGYAASHANLQIQLLPWSREALEEWRKQGLFRGLDPDKILEESRGWHSLVRQCCDAGASSPAAPLSRQDFWPTPDAALAELIAALENMDNGIDKKGVEANAHFLYEYGELKKFASSEEIASYLETLVSLHVLREEDRGFMLDPLAAAAILAKA